MVDACNESDQPFDKLKTVLLGQFNKSQWQSYFELLRLPWKCKASNLEFSWTSSNSPFHMVLALIMICMFLIGLPPSMREVVCSGNHKMAMAMIETEDAL
jgi:hypothetical protein